ncbi:MAG: lysophospholipid acyltransferase family protein [Pseudomonadota bacterium]
MVPPGGDQKVEHQTYDTRRLTYSNTFDSTAKRLTIRAIEWLTGKVSVIRMLREYNRRETPTRANFWHTALDIMRIDIQTPPEQITRIPADGPVIIVANHPHGLVDGMVIADLVSNLRLDFKILSRGILTGIDETATSFMISVPFPHEDDAQKKGIEMRAAAMEQLDNGGVVALFPSGVVASSDTFFGEVVEREWTAFTAKMIRRSGATVLPMYFPGSNSRWYQVANRISPTLRQGLLLGEIVRSCNRPQKPVIGKPLTKDDIADRMDDPRAFMAWLRDKTLALKTNPDA